MSIDPDQHESAGADGRAEAGFLGAVSALAVRAGAFGEVRIVPGDGGAPLLECAASGAAAAAWYRLSYDGGVLWASLVTADRWLSQSIEADLVHTGDNLEDLIEEELADQGLEKMRPRVEHFRSEDRLFTFRSPVPVRAGEAGAPDSAAKFLLAYEACFRNLGDMAGGEGD